jgi:hypothetical protein
MFAAESGFVKQARLVLKQRLYRPRWRCDCVQDLVWESYCFVVYFTRLHGGFFVHAGCLMGGGKNPLESVFFETM